MTKSKYPILVVEDNKITRQIFTQIVSGELPEVEFDEACNLEDMFDKLRGKRYDLIFFDLGMCRGDYNYDSLRRAQNTNESMIVLGMSGFGKEYFDRMEEKPPVEEILASKSTEDIVASIRKYLAIEGEV